jgi:hypothetical protein
MYITCDVCSWYLVEWSTSLDSHNKIQWMINVYMAFITLYEVLAYIKKNPQNFVQAGALSLFNVPPSLCTTEYAMLRII